MSERSLHPWAGNWLRLIHSFADDARFARGIDYVDSGAVLELTVGRGIVIGRVTGSRRTPYEVVIKTPVISEDVLLGIPLHYLAELLTERTQDRVFDEIITLAPRIIPESYDVDFSCTCPDWGYPCKHGIATALAFSDLIQKDPSSFLTFRGIDIRMIIKAMARHTDSRGSQPDNVVRLFPSPKPVQTSLRQPKKQEPLPLQVDASRFWEGEDLQSRKEFRINRGPDQPPEWILDPPLPWPERKGTPTYLEVIFWAYDLLNDPNASWDEFVAHRAVRT